MQFLIDITIHIWSSKSNFCSLFKFLCKQYSFIAVIVLSILVLIFKGLSGKNTNWLCKKGRVRSNRVWRISAKLLDSLWRISMTLETFSNLSRMDHLHCIFPLFYLFWRNFLYSAKSLIWMSHKLISQICWV